MHITNNDELKLQVKEFWNERSCGEVYAAGDSDRQFYEAESQARYELEPYIHDFARFSESQGKDVLEVGVGMGSDHAEWAKAQPSSLHGIDLTPRAIEHTTRRLKSLGLKSTLQVGDAEKLPFADNLFDIVYSWGVLHHSPQTGKAINEIHRVLKPGGVTRIMIYHTYSLTGYMLWVRYGLLRGRPFRSLASIYETHLESPGTKAYTVAETRDLFARFSTAKIRIQLNQGDLLQGAVGQRHRGIILSLAKKFWPRWFFKRFFKNHGLYVLIEAQK